MYVVDTVERHEQIKMERYSHNCCYQNTIDEFGRQETKAEAADMFCWINILSTIVWRTTNAWASICDRANSFVALRIPALFAFFFVVLVNVPCRWHCNLVWVRVINVIPMQIHTASYLWKSVTRVRNETSERKIEKSHPQTDCNVYASMVCIL